MGSMLAFVGTVKEQVNPKICQQFPFLLIGRKEKNMLFLQHKVPDFQHIESGLSWNRLQ